MALCGYESAIRELKEIRNRDLFTIKFAQQTDQGIVLGAAASFTNQDRRGGTTLAYLWAQDDLLAGKLLRYVVYGASNSRGDTGNLVSLFSHMRGNSLCAGFLRKCGFDNPNGGQSIMASEIIDSLDKLGL